MMPLKINCRRKKIQKDKMYGILDTTKDDHNIKPESVELEEVTENSKDLNNCKFESFINFVRILHVSLIFR